MKKSGPVNRPFFSVITPVHLWNPDRVDKFLQCAQSLRDQTFKNFEWIVVDDGSPMDFDWGQIKDIATIIIHKNHEERVIAYNEAFRRANGSWFAVLDSDDSFRSDFLETFYRTIGQFPKYRLFNCGISYLHSDGNRSYREPFIPRRKTRGHEIFGGGNIVNGSYVWSRLLYDELGGFPDRVIENIDCSSINYGGVRDLFMGTPYDFSAKAQLEFPEIQQFFFVDHEDEPDKVIKELGNPWGQDYYLFYKYTREYHTKAIFQYLLEVHPR